MRQFTDDELLAIQRLIGLSERAKLTIGQAPERMPIQVPVSSSAQIIGSISVLPDSFQILLNETVPIESIKNFYKEQLTAAGWIEQELTSLQNKGFRYAPEVVKRQLDRCSKFYHAFEDVELSIEITPQEVNRSSQATVLLSLEKSPKNETIAVLSLPPFPPLSDPAESLRLVSSGGTNKEYSAFLCLETDLDLQDLYTHYRTQLEAEDWTRVDEGQNGALMWGSWRMFDHRNQAWLGLLNIAKLGGVENQYNVQMRVIRQSPE
jgi:hypothetical protein